MASSYIDFDDLEDDIKEQLILEAFEELVHDYRVPYGIMTGDEDTWNNYDPAIRLARLNYESSFE